ncbi:MAG TPA: replicative DNA helicase [Ilumatobacter sp.]|nr:replicative DNA helicase [Ilumatobacter sp.]
MPPHNIEAEESVLGALLLSRDAINAVGELSLAPGDFYRPSHQHIFDAIRSLYGAGNPVDVVTVADELRRHGLLDQIGGAAALHDLQNATPAISSAGHYAKIVQDTAILRQLIFAAGDIAELAYSEPDDVAKALDEAESKVFRVGDQRSADTIRMLDQLLPEVLDSLQSIYDKKSKITGTPTGYADLDELLSGLQPNALYIVGARPAMGKCVHFETPIVDPSTGEVLTALELMERAEAAGAMQAIALGSDGRQATVDMSHVLADGIKPVFRVRTRSGREVTITATHPLLTARGWQPLEQVEVGQPIAVPSRLPVFGHDPLPNAEIDLLVEQCRRGDVPVPPEVFRLPEAQVRRFVAGLVCNRTYRAKARHFAAQVSHLLLRLGQTSVLRPCGSDILVECDATSPLVPVEVWDDIVKAKGELSWAEINRRVGKSAGHNWHPYRGRVRRETIAKLAEALDSDVLRWWASPDVLWDDIVSIEEAGWTQVIDFTVPKLHNFVAADMYLHNTAFGLGLAVHAAQQSGKPTLVFSLEMAHQELTQRILASEARVDSTKIRTGDLSEAEWRKIGTAIGRLEVPLFLDDNPRVSVMEIRAKARRLKAQYGGLAAVVIDYIQLMGGNGAAENRQLEVSEISRNLKILARELEVPIIALSQLSRNLEARADKRPMLSDLRESGCLTADTRLVRADTNAEVTLGELVESGETGFPVWSLDEHYRLVPGTLTAAFPSGVKETFRLRLASGRWVDASANHPFLTLDGWQRVDALTPGSRIAVARRVPETGQSAATMSDAELTLLGHLIGDGCTLDRHAVQYTTTDPENVAAVVDAARSFGVTARVVPERTWTQVFLPSPKRLTHGVHHPISTWLRELGVWNRRAWEKAVPAAVFVQPAEKIAHFLRHLWSTDGSVSAPVGGRAGRIYYATTSRQLADDVAALLLRLDIRARVRTVPHAVHRTSYHVDVTGRDEQLRFGDVVGVHGVRSERLADLVAAIEGKTSNTNVDTIPADVWNHVRHKALPAAGLTTRQLAQALEMQYCGSTLYKHGVSRDRMARVAAATDDPWLSDLATSDVLWDTVVAIEPLGPQPVFDATIDTTHNFVANGIVAHNSLEQDADVVMFLYRDEVYHSDSPDKGSAEVIVAKHRAGPIGTKRLVFLGQYTRFDNAARV